MMLHPVMNLAAANTTAALRAIEDDQLTAPTPCTEFDVRGLVNHVIFWSAFASEAAARKRPVADSVSVDHDFTQQDWRQTYTDQLNEAVAAWAEQDAWEGNTSLAGGAMPATMVGKLLVAELAVHGWDVAAATGQRYPWPDEVTQVTHSFMTEMAPMGRQYGAFGPQVPVTDTAPLWQRALGLAGRDPEWSRN